MRRLKSPNGARPPWLRPRPRLPPAFRPTDTEPATESAVPTVLVYESPQVSVSDVPTVSVIWLTTNRCSVPISSLAARASSPLPSRMNAIAALPRPSRSRTPAGIDRNASTSPVREVSHASAEPVEDVTAEPVGAEQADHVRPRLAGCRLAQHVGQGRDQVGAEHPVPDHAGPPVQRGHPQPGARLGDRRLPGPERVEPAQPGLEHERPLDHHALGRAAAEQGPDPLELARGEQARNARRPADRRRRPAPGARRSPRRSADRGPARRCTRSSSAQSAAGSRRAIRPRPGRRPGRRRPRRSAASASTSASAGASSPVPRSSWGRSRGASRRAAAARRAPPGLIRSPATAPSVRSTTLTSPPADSRGAASVVTSADQPASVPPATSIRSIPAGRPTANQAGCRSKTAVRRCQARYCAACSRCARRERTRLGGAGDLDPVAARRRSRRRACDGRATPTSRSPLLQLAPASVPHPAGPGRRPRPATRRRAARPPAARPRRRPWRGG